MIEANTVLLKYKKFEISKGELLSLLGGNLKALEVENPIEVSVNDVINLLENYQKNNITKTDLLDWVNIIWFTDLYEYVDFQEDCIASVMNELEEIDENDDKISKENILRYINALKGNKVL